jgi:hypothetical protein
MHSLVDFLKDNKDAISSAGTIFAVAVFAFAFFQYRRAESWKKSEFIAKLYKEFVDDPECQRAMWMMDWEETRQINFGSEDKPLIETCTPEKLASALRKHDEIRFTEVEVKIRDTFDRFFMYVEQFERAMQNKLVQQNQVYPYFAYWIELLGGKRHLSDHVRNSILTYLHLYGFNDVQRFLARWPK